MAALVVTRSPRWTTALVGPLAWLVFLVADYALAPWACGRSSGRPVLGAVAALALATALVASVVAWRRWNAVGRLEPDDAPPGGRAAFLAITGLGINVLFALAILAGSMPLLVLTPCK